MVVGLIFKVAIIKVIIAILQRQYHFRANGNLMVSKNVAKGKVCHASCTKNIADLQVPANKI